MVKTSWLYSLRKEELSEICGSLDLATKGTVEDMRKAVAALIATPDLSTEMKAKLTEMEAKYAAKMLQLPECTMRGASPKCQAPEHISCGAAMDRICKWSVRYDGESCALEFIARVEELCEMYDLPTDIMPRIIMELLHGKAAIWYRNNRRVWSGWLEFKRDFLKFFLPTGYLERLDDQVRRTCQLAGEKFRDYALRPDAPPKLYGSAEAPQDRLKQPEYQLFFGDTSSKDLNELIALGERFEDIPAPATTPPRRETTVIRPQPGRNAPFMTKTTDRSNLKSIGNARQYSSSLPLSRRTFHDRRDRHGSNEKYHPRKRRRIHPLDNKVGHQEPLNPNGRWYDPGQSTNYNGGNKARRQGCNACTIGGEKRRRPSHPGNGLPSRNRHRDVHRRRGHQTKPPNEHPSIGGENSNVRHIQCLPTGECPPGAGQRANGNPGDRQRQSHSGTENQPVSHTPTNPVNNSYTIRTFKAVSNYADDISIATRVVHRSKLSRAYRKVVF
uniref:Retrotransposon gag domain-containing protein n=1 Tax=Glossina palpalis gambiensis TaxID=67801 RepID=A0A1B0C5G6_9MUSC